MMTLRTAFLTCILACAMPLAVLAAQIDEPFADFFARNQREGTLLSIQAMSEVQRRAWGPRFRDALLAQFHGQPLNGMELSVAPEAGKAPRVGLPVALEFTVTNHGAQELKVVTGGNCHTVHGVMFTLINPNGSLYWSMGLTPSGGGHCFCSQIERLVPKGASVKLDHHTDRGVIPWTPSKPGRYYVIAEYHMRGQGIAYSAPLALDVQ